MTYTYYEPAPYVNLVVGLSALNPSGRADITCSNISLRLLHMPGMWTSRRSTCRITSPWRARALTP